MKKIKLILFLVFTFFLLSGCENNNEIVAKCCLDDNVYDMEPEKIKENLEKFISNSINNTA